MITIEMTERFYSSWAVPELREVRGERMLTQRALAKESGVSLNTIVRLEHGEHAQLGTIKKLAAALGVSVDYLIGREPTP